VNLFKAFDTVDKDQVLEKIKKDLKGKPFEELQWVIEEGIQLDPIHFEGDFDETINLDRTNNDWLIGSSFTGDDPKAINTAILDELSGGLELIQIHLNNKHVDQLYLIFNKVFASMVRFSFILEGALDISSFIKALKTICKKQKLNLDQISGNVYFNVAHENTLHQLFEIFPNLNLLIPFTNTGNIAQDCADQIDQAVDCLHHEKLSTVLNFSNIEFQQTLGNLFLLEISKLRAMKLLWMNVQNNYQVAFVPIQIEAHIDMASQKEDMYTNMIQASAQSMAAIIGGAKTLISLPSNAKEGANSFSRRIARNVQHIMKLESFLHRVDDPSAGSYSIETLTNAISEASWDIFIKK